MSKLGRKTTKKGREFVAYTGIHPATGAPAFTRKYRYGQRPADEVCVFRGRAAAEKCYLHVRKVRILVEEPHE